MHAPRPLVGPEDPFDPNPGLTVEAEPCPPGCQRCEEIGDMRAADAGAHREDEREWAERG